jgi:6-phosphogluconolactonase (cycloisomerase 2 family)
MARTRAPGVVCSRKPHLNMEIKQRMSTRFAWLLGVVALVAMGVLVACGTTYNSSSDGLVLVGSQGSAAIQTFSFNLGTGHIGAIDNPTSSTSAETCLLPGIPSSVVLDPAGAFAYAIVNQADACSGSATGILAFKVNSGGTLTAVGSPIADPNPVALSMDSAGKFLFVAEGQSTVAITNALKNSTPCVQTTAQNGVCVYAISDGSLTPVALSFTLPSAIQSPNFAALAATPTVLPKNGITGQNSVCSDVGNNPPTSEYLYAVDSVNNEIVEFSVNTSTGALTNAGPVAPVSTGSVPSGVAVDPCDRFVYVANNQSNNISAYSICNGSVTQSTTLCPSVPDGTLVALSGSPFSLSGGGANEPGPMLVDPFGKALYVVGVGSGTVSIFSIAQVSGGLAAGNPATVATGSRPTSIAIRSDDSWLFVTNFDSQSLSQYSVTPSTGNLTPQTATTTDNHPWGVAVK